MEMMESPCINICTLDPLDGLCTGCHRSIEEIMSWTRYTAGKRGSIMADLAHRAATRNQTPQETATV